MKSQVISAVASSHLLSHEMDFFARLTGRSINQNVVLRLQLQRWALYAVTRYHRIGMKDFLPLTDADNIEENDGCIMGCRL